MNTKQSCLRILRHIKHIKAWNLNWETELGFEFQIVSSKCLPVWISCVGNILEDFSEKFNQK